MTETQGFGQKHLRRSPTKHEFFRFDSPLWCELWCTSFESATGNRSSCFFFSREMGKIIHKFFLLRLNQYTHGYVAKPVYSQFHSYTMAKTGLVAQWMTIKQVLGLRPFGSVLLMELKTLSCLPTATKANVASWNTLTSETTNVAKCSRVVVPKLHIDFATHSHKSVCHAEKVQLACSEHITCVRGTSKHLAFLCTHSSDVG